MFKRVAAIISACALLGLSIAFTPAQADTPQSLSLTSSSNNCVSPNAPQAVLGIQVSSLTGSGAVLTISNSADGTHYTAINGIVPATRVQSSTLTADGFYRVMSAGSQGVKVCVTTTGTGTAFVGFWSSPSGAPEVTSLGLLDTGGITTTAASGQSSTFTLNGQQSCTLSVTSAGGVATSFTSYVGDLAGNVVANPLYNGGSSFIVATNAIYVIPVGGYNSAYVSFSGNSGSLVYEYSCSAAQASSQFQQMAGSTTVTNFPTPAATDASGGILVGCDANPGCPTPQPTLIPVAPPVATPGYAGYPMPTTAPALAQLGCWYTSTTNSPSLIAGNGGFARCDTNAILRVTNIPNKHQKLTAASGTCTNIDTGPLSTSYLSFATSVQTGTITIYDDTSSASCTGNIIQSVATGAANTVITMPWFLQAGDFLDYKWTVAAEAGSVYVLYAL